MDSLVIFSRVIIMSFVFFILSLFDGAKGTLQPNCAVSLDCGSQQTFNCIVSGPSAGWSISGLSGISVTSLSGQSAANNNARITTTDTRGITQTSTITITGFTTSDNGAAIQCINLNDNSVQGMTSILVEPPSCPVDFSANRNCDFSSATVTYQLAASPVTSTTVTYCPTSSPNCGYSITCTSPCTISGLYQCVEYILSAIPTNNCGSPTGCTGNSMIVPAKGVPSCPSSVVATAYYYSNDAITVTWQQPPNISPATFTSITFCPTSSPNCGISTTCTTSPCTISGLDPGTEYQFTVVPNNYCGSPTGCTGNTATAQTADVSVEVQPLLAGIIPSVVLLLSNIISVVVAVLVTRYCCNSKSSKKSSPSNDEEDYEQVERPSAHDDIPMSTNPAYCPVIQN